ncbi:MAG TPA: peptide chain release factor N(5)-glutamine methyltransferase [Candidatus Limnocylindrales bacterium]|nr:peptide chain release factor N(5)-glutamine methyltransferase [Candidatus Limnocylindrales bacterium]
MSTVREALEAGVALLREAGSESPRLDAELLLGHVVGLERSGVLAHLEAPLGEGQRASYEGLLERRAAGEPVAYIRGIKEFFGLAFGVDARALIPRPETERLVELALARITERLTASPRPPGSKPLRVIDVGTGSGAIAVTLAVVLRRRGYGVAVRFVASDTSPEALDLALENAVGHGVGDLIDFRQADLLDPAVQVGGRSDLVVANLPYVPSAVVPELPIAASFEPIVALDGGRDGLDLLRRLMAALPEGVAADGGALLEIASDQADGVRLAAARLLPGWPIEIHADLAGRPRVAELRRPSAG